MDEPTPLAASVRPTNEPANARLWMLALVAIVLLLRVWLIVNTEVPARDSIGFIRYSLMFDHALAGEIDDTQDPPQAWSWQMILKGAHQHPGYPVLVWVTAAPLRAIWGTTPDVMRVAAQLVSLVASLLLALVMFRLGNYLWNCYVGFFAALVFQCLPIPGHHLSDGISDGLFLFLAILAVDTILRARDAGSLRAYALGGVFVGLSYLVRPEGFLILPAAFLFLLGLQFTREHRTGWKIAARDFAVLVLGWAVAGSPYYLATGTLTNKPGPRTVFTDEVAPAQVSLPPDAAHGPALFAAIFLHADSPVEQIWRTLRALSTEVSQSFNYLGILFVLWAFFFCGRTLFQRPGAVLLATYAFVHASILVVLGFKVNYVSDRHVMALVALGSYPCVIGIAHLASLVIRRLTALDPRTYLDNRLVTLAASGCLVILIGICVAKTVTRLHGNRAGNHEAGLFLRAELRPGDEVYDDHNWSHFYAGQVFSEFDKIEVPPDARRFFVLTRSKDDEVHKQREILESGLRNDAKLVYWWPNQHGHGPDRARVVVYSTPHHYTPDGWIKKGNYFGPDPARGFRPLMLPGGVVSFVPVARPK